MLPHSALLALCTVLGSAILGVSGLGSLCTASLGAGNASASDPYWLQDITHQGYAPYASDPSTYAVFRNVKDYGAAGDGVTDDTDAINDAISSGSRCGDGCGSSTTTPAVVFFPQGTYLISAPLIAYYYTVLVGDAKVPPTLLASSSFSGLALVDADPYIPNGYGAQWYTNQDNFYRSVRNFVFDLTQTSATSGVYGIHWQVSQSTSLLNLVFEMSTASDTTQVGLYMENGSGGFMGDMVFNGGKYGLEVGNQQFTVRNVTINNANTGRWLFVGFALTTGTTSGSSQGVGSENIIDAAITDVTYFIQPSSVSSSLDGSIVLNNIALTNVGYAVASSSSDVVLAGGTYTINSWAQGNVYSGSDGTGTFTQGDITAISKPSELLASTGWIFGKGHPQYIDYSPSQFISVRSQGATGDGSTDDTAAIQDVFNNYAGCYIIYFDAGIYMVSSTITIPAGTIVVGEAWSTIMGYGSYFQNYNAPQVVVRVGENSGDEGVAEITDMIFSTQGPAAGAIVVEWNVHDPAGEQGAAGDGTDLQDSQCPASTTTSGNSDCFAAFLGIYITSGASAYLEGLWVWLADHDLDASDSPQLTLWSARGILSESQGPVWMIGTCEHHIMYQYGLMGATNHYLGFIQTETPYFQPNPGPTAPFIPSSTYGDPSSWPANAAWALYVDSTSSNILVYGAGHYSFFQDYAETCDDDYNCQSQIVEIENGATDIAIYGLNTVYTTYQLSVNNEGIINYQDNLNGLAETVTAWTL
ncbi:glycoside hydrolase family 55 protein [Laetiporus sulphureus 93-53]|uniref:Glycoside hydrolase family 55 protein n=1 Tax=Laetiporus sulphureus 93-53 TaxID=1314785 RepID=A0A165GQX9_9APHY|nr:glycoside hydrolase family 55 protein [Laetiporus sulphureus 93-53]KZT10683.1 glycoside hydrolase family 55 protein [Laetiporus sulphureus 93-53]